LNQYSFLKWLKIRDFRVPSNTVITSPSTIENVLTG